MPESLELEQLIERGSEEELFQQMKQLSSKKSKFKRCQCPYLGIVLATISSLFLSLCSVIVKWMVNVDPIELAAFRSIGILLPAIPIVIYCKENPFPEGKRVMLFLRSFLGATALMLVFYSLQHMPLADASVIISSVPIFVAIFARLFLNEPCGIFNAITVILTLIGVVLITRPPIIFDGMVPVSTSPNVKTDFWGSVAAISATLIGANVYVLVRALKGLHFSVVMINFGSFASVLTLLVSYSLGTLCLPRSGIDGILIVALAIFSFAGQILLTLSLKIEQAGPVAIARSADLVFAFIWQIVFFKEVPNMYSIGGAFLVTSSVLLIGVKKWAESLPEGSKFKRSLGILAK